MLLTAASLVVLAAGCSKDTDCKGDRICERAVCVSPRAQGSVDAGEWALPANARLKPATPAPPPAPPLVAAPPPAPSPVGRPPLRPKGISAEERVFPRVVRKPGQVCVQSLDDKGSLQESCRPE